MADLKSKATTRAKTKSNDGGGKLAKKAKSRAPKVQAQTVEEIEREEGMGPQPQVREPGGYNKPPPLPPTLLWLRKRAQIPALRGGGQG
jgi:hypothetical protein